MGFNRKQIEFVHTLAKNYLTVKYICYDSPESEVKPADTMDSGRGYRTVGMPFMFGLSGFESFEDSDSFGDISYPSKGDKARWGHAVMVVGYEDDYRVTNLKCKASTKGALLIRNSWGKGWGDNCYGWLPYDYVLNCLALDFWSVLDIRWIYTGNFGL